MRAALQSVDARMSLYRPESELNGFNRAGGGAPVPMSAELFAVLAAARDISRWSNGAFDVTVAPASKHGASVSTSSAACRRPNRSRCSAARSTGANWTWILATGPPARAPGPQVDLGGIAKGYGVDAVAKSLDGLGIAHYMIEVGGEVRTRGVNGASEPWQIGIEEPDATPQRARHIVPLSGRAMATSGDYRIYFEEGGRRYSHEIDPMTAAPIAHRLCSVSVVADDCMRADGLATALIVLGPGPRIRTGGAQRRGRAVHRTRSTRPLQRPHDVGLRRPGRASGGMSFATLGTVFVLAAVLIGAAVLAMAVGVIFKRPCLRGSCGGPSVVGPDGEKISCSDCPNRTKRSAA